MPLQYNPQIAVALGKPSNATQGPRVVTQTLAFASPPVPIVDDLTLEGMDNAINNIQAVWVDNNNEGTFTITLLQTSQVIRVPGFTQGFYPVLTNEGVNYSAKHDVSGASVYLAWYDNPVEFVQWATQTAAAPGIPVSATAQSSTSTALTATVAAVAGRTNFVTEVIVQGLGATAGGDATLSFSGVTPSIGPFHVAIPGGVGTPINCPTFIFNPPLQASAPNTAILVQLTAPGAGNTEIALNVIGYQV